MHNYYIITSSSARTVTSPTSSSSFHLLAGLFVDMSFGLHGFLNFSNPALGTLLPTIGAAYSFQIAVSIPAIILQEDRFYGKSYICPFGRLIADLSGSLTYLGCMALSLYLPALRARSLARSQGQLLPSFPAITAFHPRQIVLTSLTLLWSIRLGISRKV